MTSSQPPVSWTPEPEGAWNPPEPEGAWSPREPSAGGPTADATADAFGSPAEAWGPAAGGPAGPGPVPPVGPGSDALTMSGSWSTKGGSPSTTGGSPSPYTAGGDPWTAAPSPARRPGDVLMQDGRDLADWIGDPVGTAVGRATDHWPRPLRWLAQIGVEVGGWILRGRLLDLILRR